MKDESFEEYEAGVEVGKKSEEGDVKENGDDDSFDSFKAPV